MLRACLTACRPDLTLAGCSTGRQGAPVLPGHRRCGQHAQVRHRGRGHHIGLPGGRQVLLGADGARAAGSFAPHAPHDRSQALQTHHQRPLHRAHVQHPGRHLCHHGAPGRLLMCDVACDCMSYLLGSASCVCLAPHTSHSRSQAFKADHHWPLHLAHVQHPGRHLRHHGAPGSLLAFNSACDGELCLLGVSQLCISSLS